MNKVVMISQFGEDNIIERTVWKRLRYNAKITKPENCDVIIVNGDDVRRLKRLDCNLLNPKKQSLFGRDKIDPNEYIIFFIDTAYHDAAWGGNVDYLDESLGNIQEKVYIRANFSFKIFRGDYAISLLSEIQDNYSRRYFTNKIRFKIDSTIKSYISKILSEKGFIRAQQEIVNVSAEAQEKINKDVLSVLGIEMANLNITIEEEQAHSVQRNEYEWNSLK